METSREQIKVSVRELVEFILRSGDIDNRHHASSDTAMQEGSRIHRMIQKRMGSDYQAEVTLRYTHTTEHYDLVVEGRADGIIDTPKEKLIDEIKHDTGLFIAVFFCQSVTFVTAAVVLIIVLCN